MSVRIGTAIDGDRLKLVKVRRCRECPNAIEQAVTSQSRRQAVRDKNPPPQKTFRCDLREDRAETGYFDEVIPCACPLPSLLEISKQAGSSIKGKEILEWKRRIL